MPASSRKRTALLANIEAEQRRSLDRLAVNAAATLAQRGEIALTRLRYAEAAKHFADAAAVFPPGSAHETERMRYLDREAQAHYGKATNSATTTRCEPRSRGPDA